MIVPYDAYDVTVKVQVEKEKQKEVGEALIAAMKKHVPDYAVKCKSGKLLTISIKVPAAIGKGQAREKALYAIRKSCRIHTTGLDWTGRNVIEVTADVAS